MAFNIAYKKSVHRDLKKISKSEAKKVVNQLEKELSKKADQYFVKILSSLPLQVAVQPLRLNRIMFFHQSGAL